MSMHMNCPNCGTYVGGNDACSCGWTEPPEPDVSEYTGRIAELEQQLAEARAEIAELKKPKIKEPKPKVGKENPAEVWQAIVRSAEFWNEPLRNLDSKGLNNLFAYFLHRDLQLENESPQSIIAKYKPYFDEILNNPVQYSNFAYSLWATDPVKKARAIIRKEKNAKANSV